MLQSHIILTQSFVDQKVLNQLATWQFFAEHNFLFSKIPSLENLSSNYQHYLNSNQILEAKLDDKDDFRQYLATVYQQYSKPTLLFLGSLDVYSTALQEGMLRLLEEPPANLVILLYAQTRNLILPTISSRCQFHQLDQDIVISLLDKELLEKVKKKLPPAVDFIKSILQKSQKIPLPDVSKVEREELSFWLWQLECYVREYYKQNPAVTFASLLRSVLEAKKLNAQNVQKKFVLAKLVY